MLNDLATAMTHTSEVGYKIMQKTKKYPQSYVFTAVLLTDVLNVLVYDVYLFT